jgi:hypothetical protein
MVKKNLETIGINVEDSVKRDVLVRVLVEDFAKHYCDIEDVTDFVKDMLSSMTLDKLVVLDATIIAQMVVRAAIKKMRQVNETALTNGQLVKIFRAEYVMDAEETEFDEESFLVLVNIANGNDETIAEFNRVIDEYVDINGTDFQGVDFCNNEPSKDFRVWLHIKYHPNYTIGNITKRINHRLNYHKGGVKNSDLAVFANADGTFDAVVKLSFDDAIDLTTAEKFMTYRFGRTCPRKWYNSKVTKIEVA